MINDMPLLAFDNTNTNTNNCMLLMLRSCVSARTIPQTPAAVHGNKGKTELHLDLKHKVSHLKQKKNKQNSKSDDHFGPITTNCQAPANVGSFLYLTEWA